jgi:hypothetical protein
MPGSSNTSFIPKHTPSKGERKSSPRQLFLGTLLVRILFFAVLLAAAGTFFYERSLKTDLAVAITNFTTAASSYNADGEKLATIVRMDNRLRQANDIFAGNVSTAAIFDAMEEATIVSSQFKALEITREKPDKILVVANVQTDTFDSTLFQRSIFTGNDILSSAIVEDVTVEGTATEEIESTETNILFKTTITINPADIPSLLTEDSVFTPVVEETVPAATTTETTPDAAEVEIGFTNDESS